VGERETDEVKRDRKIERGVRGKGERQWETPGGMLIGEEIGVLSIGLEGSQSEGSQK